MRVIQFDGGAVPNPGTRAIGVIIIENGIVIKEISRKLVGPTTELTTELVKFNIQ
jgi:hypothetical protein